MSGYDDVLEMAFGVTGVYTAWEVLFFLPGCVYSNRIDSHTRDKDGGYHFLISTSQWLNATVASHWLPLPRAGLALSTLQYWMALFMPQAWAGTTHATELGRHCPHRRARSAP